MNNKWQRCPSDIEKLREALLLCFFLTLKKNWVRNMLRVLNVWILCNITQHFILCKHSSSFQGQSERDVFRAVVWKLWGWVGFLGAVFLPRIDERLPPCNSLIYTFLNAAGRRDSFSSKLEGSRLIDIVQCFSTTAFTEIPPSVPDSLHNIWYCRLFKT